MSKGEMVEFGICVTVVGLALVVLCSPQRDAILWRLPKFAHRLIRWLSGYELAELSSWSIKGPRYVRWYQWRKIERKCVLQRVDRGQNKH